MKWCGFFGLAFECGSWRSSPLAGYFTVLLCLGWLDLAAETVRYSEPPQKRLVQHGNLSLGVGWRDNILLSTYSPASRSYVFTEFEELCWAKIGNRWDVFALFEGYGNRHEPLSDLVDGEHRLNGHLELRRTVGDRLKFSSKLMALHELQPVDYSEDATNRFLAVLTSSSLGAGEACSIRVAPTISAELSVYIKNVNFFEIPGDYREVRQLLKIEFKKWEHFKSRFTYNFRRKIYNQRPAYSAGGRPLSGSRLELNQIDFEANGDLNWSAGGDWLISVSAGYLSNQDGLYGYFDYIQRKERLMIEYARGAWLFEIECYLSNMVYLNQTAGSGINPPKRVGADVAAKIRAERDFIFLESTRLSARSNQEEFEYDSTGVMFGVSKKW